MLTQILGPVEVRVLGALIEKELSTPDHYPLSLNALVSACNQSSNRDPVMTLDDPSVKHALDVLRRLSLVRSFQGSGERVPKFQHLLADAYDLSRAELAVLCVLTLRGPQTMGEVRSRAARLMPTGEPDGIEAAVEALMAREPAPAVTALPRQPGQKEVRYAHLLGGEVVYEKRETLPLDNNAYRFPVSVKGVIIRDGAVVLVENGRREWELPGGKLEISESPERCVAREIEEELQLDVTPAALVDSWIYAIADGVHVLILTYGCVETSIREAALSHEHTRVQWFRLDEIDALPMPDGYKASIHRWARQCM